MIIVVYAHPYPRRSLANRVLLEHIEDLAGVEVRSLYDLYPDFDLDAELEQQRLAQSSAVVWQHPLYWYSVPPLLKLWFDKVLAYGWAYGPGGRALRGKSCQWVVTAGGDEAAYRVEGMHGHEFQRFTPPVEQTARFCGMRWQAPIIVQGAHRLSQDKLHEIGRKYRECLLKLSEQATSEQPHA